MAAEMSMTSLMHREALHRWSALILATPQDLLNAPPGSGGMVLVYSFLDKMKLYFEMCLTYSEHNQRCLLVVSLEVQVGDVSDCKQLRETTPSPYESCR
jgi:hypothetical protein